MRIKITPDKLMQLVIPEKLKKLRKVVKEYKSLLLDRLRNDKRLADKKFIKNVRDLTQFYQRLPSKLEEQLQLIPILPTYIGAEPLPARLDLELFAREISSRTNHIQYYVNISERSFELFKEESESKDIDVARHIVEEVVKFFEEQIRVNLKLKNLRLGFFCRLQATCIYKKDEEEIIFYVSSLTHRRQETFVSMLSELRLVLQLLGKELLAKIYENEGNQSGLTFDRITRINLDIFYYNKKLVNFEEQVLQTGKGWRELPEWIRDSRSIVNIQNKDDSCFKWCVTRYFFEENGINYRVTKKLKEKAKEFKWFGLDNPKTFTEENLCKFEDAYNVRIVIFGIDDTPGFKIMHMRNDKGKYEKIYIGHYINHFFVIRNLKGFIRMGAKAKAKTVADRSIYVCESCVTVISTELQH
jgi:hypothetical protein